MDTEAVKSAIVTALQEVFDPELPVNIYDLGLIYDIGVATDGVVNITMTLTAPACPASNEIMFQVQSKVSAVPGVTDVNTHLTFDPPWSRDMMSEDALFELGWL